MRKVRAGFRVRRPVLHSSFISFLPFISFFSSPLLFPVVVPSVMGKGDSLYGFLLDEAQVVGYEQFLQVLNLND